MKLLMLTNILFTLVRGVWAIDPNYAESMRPLLQQFRETRQIDMKVVASSNAEKLQAHVKMDAALVSPQWNQRVGGYDFTGSYPEGSIAIVPLQGAVMKQDFCGALGTQTISSYIAQIAANPNIAGTILYTDSPGGAALGTNDCATTLRSLRTKKPIVTFVDGMECSAAMWIGSATSYTIANKNDYCIIGSIGTYMQLEDWSEVEGQPKVHAIYADASSDKNADYKEAMKGNYEPLLTNMINPLNNSFLAGMRANRYGKGMNTKNVFTGKTFDAQGALDNGLIDQIGTIGDAVAKIKEITKLKSAA